MTPLALSATLGRLARAADPDPPADGRLVSHFARTRDPDAFAELVRRLGPMVLGVCRRVTGDSHLADDAFQAAFLVLARRAADVNPAEAVRGWVYGVAVRVAREARAVSARRRAREAPVPTLPDRAAEPHVPPDADALRALDEEVAALPEHVRAAVVLCELDGASRKDAAARLGVPEGTLSSRLAKGRKLLAERLRRRGVTAVGLAVLAPVAVSARLTVATSALASGAAPAAVAVLARGVVRAMVLQKLKLVSLVVGVLAPVFVTAVIASPPVPAGAPPAAKAEPPAKGPNRILVYLDGRLTLLDPDGKNGVPVTAAGPPPPLPGARLSPDGTRVAYSVEVEGPTFTGRGPWWTTYKLFVRRTDGTGPAVDLGVDAQSFAWSPDGTRIAATEYVRRGEDHVSVHKVVTVATKAAAPLPLPADHILHDWSRDGRFFVTEQAVVPGPKGEPGAFRLLLMNRDGTEHRLLNAPTDNLTFARLSPDGGRVLCVRYEPEAPGGPSWPVPVVVDVATRTAARLAGFPPDGDLLGFSWSPDGARVAYTWQPRVPPRAAPPAGIESFLVVCDADGANRRTIAAVKSNDPNRVTLAGPDWR